jgi:YHS domain-containing protein
MTAARQKRKRYCAWVLVAAGLAFAVASQVSVAATTEMIVVDRYTGLAVGGYDPVAFFTEGKPLEGSAEFEFRYGGAVWRFCNIGNRDAFAARPDVYMPRFGGYDPTSVAGGVATAGNPNVWLIAGQRLFLFYNRDRLEQFVADPDGVLAEAERKWPTVTSTLSP